MQVYDFTEPELDMFRNLCNFTEDEREYFELRARGKSNVQIAMEMNVSESKVSKLARKVKSKMFRVLPQFKMYVAVKKGYQLKELTAEDLKFAMRSMCRDIEEFLETLYNNTELEEERTTIHSMLENLLDAL